MRSKTTQPTEETVMTLPVGALDALIRAVEGMPQDGRGLGTHMEAMSPGKNEPMMCHASSAAEGYVVVKIIRAQLADESDAPEG